MVCAGFGVYRIPATASHAARNMHFAVSAKKLNGNGAQLRSRS